VSKVERADTDLTFKIDGAKSGAEDIPLDTFLKVMNGMSTVASEVDRAVSNNQKSVRWEIIALEHHSAELSIRPVPIKPLPAQNLEISHIIRTGLYAIQSRQQKRPPAFTDQALKSLKGAVQALGGKFQLFISDAQAPVELNMETIAQIDQWLEPNREATGTIEGQLESATIHNVNRFTVWEKSGNKVECHFPKEMTFEVKQALGERVVVRGKVRYRSDGIAVSVRATRLGGFVPQNEMPQIEDLVGVWDLGMTGDQYIRRLRDAD
jgi:hypothetical protein